MSTSKIQVFISRALPEESPFLQLLEKAGHTVLGQSLLEISAFDFELPETQPDWYFFYSKNGVSHFFDHIKKQQPWLLAASVKWAAHGPATGEYLAQFVEKVDFVGAGSPFVTASAFVKIAKGQSVCFVCAEHSVHSVELQLEGRLEAQRLVVYGNKSIEKPPNLSEMDILVFTSPLNVETYFKQFSLQKNQKLIAIGSTTGAALEKSGYTDFSKPMIPTETALASTVLQIIERT